MADKGVMAAIAAAKAAKSKGTEALSQTVKVEATLTLTKILDRPGGDTRPINLAHVDELTESIKVMGLIQPLAVDRHGHLLAGGHRRAALLQLQQDDPDTFERLFPNGVPVHAIDVDAVNDQDQAIAIEAAENEKRRDYTPAEVRELADRLVKAGYSYASKGGRSRKGKKALKPALSLIVGKSEKTIQRYLNPDKKPGQKTRTSVQVSAEARLIKELERFELATNNEEWATLAAKLRERLQK